MIYPLWRNVAILSGLVVLAACTAGQAESTDVEQAPPGAASVPVTGLVTERKPPPPLAPAPPRIGRATFRFQGELTQGGWIRGQAPAGTEQAFLNGAPLALDEEGRFFAAFDRDAGGEAVLRAQIRGGREKIATLTIAPRSWKIEHVNVARRPGGASEAFMERRRPELAAIGAARSKRTGADGWKQDFIWPVRGRISGRFGSQRIYRGEPGSYHSGMDITTGESGTPFVAPADGVVVLAADNFSLEGKLLIIDHGQGLNSAFLHASRLVVAEGQAVKQGQHVGNIGSSGRATGPHLHWSLKWNEARLDPLLFVDSAG